MNKKLMAVAVAGVLAAPAAMAQTSTVQIGGFVQVFLMNHDPENSSTSQGHFDLRDSESNLQVRGEEKLGGGLSVWFQCESSMAAIFAGGASSGFCTRNSGIGFRGSWGNAFVGNWDTPQKNVTNLARGWWGANNALNGGLGFTLMNGGPSGVGNGLTTGGARLRRTRRLASSAGRRTPSTTTARAGMASASRLR
jgi:predicted porin